MPTSKQIRINFAKGEPKDLHEHHPPLTYATADPVKYVTIHMDGEELTN
jgi:hypothetical protein